MTRGDGGSSRRTVLAGLAALAAAGPAVADEAPSLVAHGILAQNPLALAFQAAPGQLPGVTLLGPKGERSIDELKGRTLLMPLWAEWCAPCMGEIPDFARLQSKYGNDKFAIVPVLSGTKKMLTPELIGEILNFLHAGVFEPLIEYNRGDKLLRAMARKGAGLAIPCNLLIAPDGHVVAREIGMKRDDDASGAASGKPGLIARAEAGESLSLWGEAAGEEFAAAMANGFLG
ncbi:MAG TPA: TlpA disulfide reductase family protein [Rhizomicrobium sp.]